MNMQNVPKYLAGYNIKKLFVPDDSSFVVVNMDYKGAEVRVFTAYARDAALIKALNEGLDMHSFFASRVFAKPYDNYANRDNPAVIPDDKERKALDRERSQIKRVVFGILYGAGPTKIAETIGVSAREAEELINLLYKMFPAIKTYADDVEAEVDSKGWVQTYFNRRRRFPLSKLSRHRGRAIRQARNFKIQSTSSDIVIAQLVEIDEPLRRDFGGRLLLTVHDSIVLQFPKKYLNQLNDFLVNYAEKRVTVKYPWLPVPFKVDIEVGPNYGECQAIDKYIAKHPFIPVQEGVIEEDELLTELKEDAFSSEHF
jgi:DNA polymerase-1